MKKSILTWKKQPHPVWGEGGEEEKIHEILKGIGDSSSFPKIQYVADNGFSIIPPCIITLNFYELYNGEDIWRFDTLKEAKEFALTLL